MLIPSAAAQQPESPPSAPPILLAETEAQPTLSISWTTRAGERITHAAAFDFGADATRRAIGDNVEAFVALGGVRLAKGAGHPRGLIVRAGFYKADATAPFFRDIRPGSAIEVELTGLRFNQAVEPSPRSGVQHLKYAPGDLESCGMPLDAGEQFNTAAPDDSLNGRVRPGTDARLGVLDGSPTSLGAITPKLEDDGSIRIAATFRYAALRNLRDPWRSDLPGTFLEPVHFHIEAEVLPEGLEPLDPVPPGGIKN